MTIVAERACMGQYGLLTNYETLSITNFKVLRGWHMPNGEKKVWGYRQTFKFGQ